jgi:YVTN family beta-propeller protein
MDFRILGPFEVYDRGEPVLLGAGKQRAVLALLLLHANEVVSVDRLIDDLWQEAPPATAGKIVQNYVSQLRRSLDEGVLVTRGHGYALRVEAGEVDVDRFRQLVEDGRRALTAGDHEHASGSLIDALGLWRGRALEDFTYEPFAQDEIQRLEELRLNVVMDRIDADLALGRGVELVGELEGLIAQHPLQERLRGQLMIALYRSGRQAEALHAYQEARRTLIDELGIEPGQALQQLEKQILNQDPSLGPPAQRKNAVPETAAGRPNRLRTVLVAALLVAVGAGTAAAILLSRDHGGKRITAIAPNSLGAIDPKTNKLVGEVTVGAFPRVAVGGGSVWAMNGRDGTMMRIDPKTMEVKKTWSITRTSILSSIAFGADSGWVVATTPGTLSRARFDQARANANFLPLVGTSDVPDVAVRGSAVWVTSQINRMVFTIDGRLVGPLEGQDLRGDVTRTRAVPLAIAIDGTAVWFTGFDPSSKAGLLARIDPARRQVVATIPLPAIPTELAVGYGAVWVAVNSENAVWRIDERTNVVQRTIPVGNGPYAVAVGEGAVWVVNTKDASVSRIDPATNRVVATILVGGSPRDIAAGDGLVWVAVA